MKYKGSIFGTQDRGLSRTGRDRIIELAKSYEPIAKKERDPEQQQTIVLRAAAPLSTNVRISVRS